MEYSMCHNYDLTVTLIHHKNDNILFFTVLHINPYFSVPPANFIQFLLHGNHHGNCLYTQHSPMTLQSHD